MIAPALASACERSATVRPSLSTNTLSAPSVISSSSEDHEDAQALVGKLSDQRLNLGLCPDIDAAGRFVEDQEFRIGAAPSRPAR
jgi:hypothetical protein